MWAAVWPSLLLAMALPTVRTRKRARHGDLVMANNAKVAAKPRKESTVQKGLARLVDEGFGQASKCILQVRVVHDRRFVDFVTCRCGKRLISTKTADLRKHFNGVCSLKDQPSIEDWYDVHQLNQSRVVAAVLGQGGDNGTVEAILGQNLSKLIRRSPVMKRSTIRRRENAAVHLISSMIVEHHCEYDISYMAGSTRPPVALMVDAWQTTDSVTDDAVEVVGIVGVSVAWDRPVLLEAFVGKESMSGEKIRDIVMDACTRHRIPNLVALIGDNTSYMPASANLLGIPYVGCFCHIGHLIASELLRALPYVHELQSKLAMLLNHHTGRLTRQKKMKEAGLVRRRTHGDARRWCTQMKAATYNNDNLDAIQSFVTIEGIMEDPGMTPTRARIIAVIAEPQAVFEHRMAKFFETDTSLLVKLAEGGHPTWSLLVVLDRLQRTLTVSGRTLVIWMCASGLCALQLASHHLSPSAHTAALGRGSQRR